MSFQELHARFNRQYTENKAWKLLRAANAPLILAFLSDLFKEDTEVPLGKARVALDAELANCRESGIWQTESNALTYLREWLQAGWLRDLDDQLSKTDACEVALRFCQNLDQRENAATASHLRIVQEAVRDLSVALSTNVEERMSLLRAKQAEIQREVDDLEAGIITTLDDREQRERIKEVYQLASVLTGDFRRVEDEIRVMDQVLRVEIIESDHSRGEILLGLLEKEQLLADTDAGRAFEGFFQLLCDQNRSTEFREQLRGILEQEDVSKHLTRHQKRYLGHLMRELTKESERVFQVRRRTEESLRFYIESGAHLETKVIDRLLGQLERQAVTLRDAGVDPQTKFTISLPSGSVKISSADSMRLKTPEEELDTSNVQTHVNTRQPSSAMLESLEAVKVLEVASAIREILATKGPLTIAGITEHYPLRAGLEELIACLRVASTIGAVDLNDREDVDFVDKRGNRFKASIPMLMLQTEQFPDRIEDAEF